MSKDTQWMPFYIGDYLRDTRHLSQGQHGAYLLLLAHYYSTGKPLPIDPEANYRIALAIASEERENVDKILKEFFTKKRDGYHNKRADNVIEARNEKRSKLSEIGRKGGMAKAIANAKANGVANDLAKPWQISGKPDPDLEFKKEKIKKEKKSPAATDAEFEAWWSVYPHKVGKVEARKAYEKARKEASTQELIDGVERYKATKPAYADWKGPAAWLNNERWKDQPAGNTCTVTAKKTHAERVKEHIEAGGSIRSREDVIYTPWELEWTNPDTKHTSHFARSLSTGEYLYWSEVAIVEEFR